MLFANNGTAPRLELTAAHHADQPSLGAVWLDLLDPTDEERAAVERATGLRIPSQADLAEIETSSRGYQDGKALYLSTPMSYRSEDGSSMVAPLGFVLTPERLLTVRFAKLQAFDTFAEHYGRGEIKPNCSASAFIALLEAVVDRLADVLEHVGSNLDQISHTVFRPGDRPARNAAKMDAKLRGTLRAVGRAGDGLSNIRDSLLGLSRLVHYTVGASRDWMPVEVMPRVATLRQDLVSLGDYDTQLTNKVQFLLDATLGFINIEQNNGIKVLTVVSVVGVPPTLVASIYGMNFEHMPELHWLYGYPYGLSVILISAVLPLVWFKWRGWI